jgi:hypothetical protein
MAAQQQTPKYWNAAGMEPEEVESLRTLCTWNHWEMIFHEAQVHVDPT